MSIASPQAAVAPVAAKAAPVKKKVDPLLLAKINALFDAMDADKSGDVSKFELIDFVQAQVFFLFCFFPNRAHLGFWSRA
jgi:hypothetical protein